MISDSDNNGDSDSDSHNSLLLRLSLITILLLLCGGACSNTLNTDTYIENLTKDKQLNDGTYTSSTFGLRSVAADTPTHREYYVPLVTLVVLSGMTTILI